MLATNSEQEVRDGVSPDGLSEQYVYSPDMVYRYAFARWWGVPEPGTWACWVGLNPATGDTEQRRRPTLERMIAWTRQRDLDGLVIVNLFAFRATDPKALKSAEDPVGKLNDSILAAASGAAAMTFAAWGSHGRLHTRSTIVAALLQEPLCLGTTASGEPRHPLYVAGDAPAEPWAASRASAPS